MFAKSWKKKILSENFLKSYVMWKILKEKCPSCVCLCGEDLKKMRNRKKFSALQKKKSDMAHEKI
jgi:hypothetical protein